MAIAREAVVQISDFTEQNLSNTCWAFATQPQNGANGRGSFGWFFFLVFFEGFRV